MKSHSSLNKFISYAFLSVIALTGMAKVEAQDRVQRRWTDYLSGSVITHEQDFTTETNRTDTLISDYYLCSDGTFVHKRMTVAGGLPHGYGGTIGDLEPQGQWRVVVESDSYGTVFPLLKLSSPGAIGLFDLAIARDNESGNEILVGGKPFTRTPDDESGCGTPGDPFTPLSPLQ